jgi:hypothetical protein
MLKKFRNAQIEAVITKHGVTHRAVAVLPDGKIVEIQSSVISPEQIYERE